MLQALAGIIIFILFLPNLAGLWDSGVTFMQQRVAADHLQQVTKASSLYVRKHQTSLLASAKPATGPMVTVADLVSDKLLPAGFASVNLWKQSYQIHIRQPEPSALQAIILTTGGKKVDDSFANVTVPGAALAMGGAAGYIPRGALGGQNSSMLLGTGGGWAVSLPSVGITSPGPGHLGSLSSFDSSSIGQDYLYRVAVPGAPELNAMQTDLDMTEHANRNVSELQFEERSISSETCTSADDQGRIFLDRLQGLYICRNNSLEIIGDSGNSSLLKNATLAKNGDRIDKPSCAKSTNTVPAIFTAPSIVEAGPDAPSLNSFQTWSTSISDTEWQVFVRVLTPDKPLSPDKSGWVYPQEDYARILVFATCAKNPTPIIP